MSKFFHVFTIIFILACTACGANFEASFGEGGEGGAGGSGGAMSTGGNNAGGSGGNGGAGGATCTPSQEVCDGLDNDCDGEVDNSLEGCMALELEFYEDSKAMVMLADTAGKAIPGQVTEDPVSGTFTVYLDGPGRLFVRLEQPVFMADAKNVDMNGSTDAYGCDEGPLNTSISDMETNLMNGAFSEGASLMECNTIERCTFTHIQGCGESEVHIFRIELAPKAVAN